MKKLLTTAILAGALALPSVAFANDIKLSDEKPIGSISADWLETADIYEITIKGMTCIYVDDYRNTALTCDWSKHQEDKDD